MTTHLHIERLRAQLLGKQGTASVGAATGPEQGPRATPAKVKVGPEHYDFAYFPELREFSNTQWYYNTQGYEWNMFRQHLGASSAVVEMDGRQLINYASYNYLDLLGDPRMQDAAKQAVDAFGTSAGSGRINMGEIPIFTEFEQLISQTLGVEDAVMAVNGYGANVATLGYLARRQDLVIYDELIHNSMLMGAKLSGARRLTFPHNDYDALEQLLVEHRQHYERVLILTEGVYSMDGDIPDIPRLIDIKRRHHALLMVDEAHSMGVIGPRGLGVVDYFGLDGADIDIHFSSMSKAFATVGGYIAGRKELIAILKHYAPGLLLYTAAPTPASAAAGLQALRIMHAEPERARRAVSNAGYFRTQARAAGLDTGLSHDSAIVPIMMPDGETAVWTTAQLFEQNICTFPMIFPVVPRNTERLRFFISAAHTREHIDRTVELLVDLRKNAPASKGLF